MFQDRLRHHPAPTQSRKRARSTRSTRVERTLPWTLLAWRSELSFFHSFTGAKETFHPRVVAQLLGDNSALVATKKAFEFVVGLCAGWKSPQRERRSPWLPRQTPYPPVTDALPRW